MSVEMADYLVLKGLQVLIDRGETWRQGPHLEIDNLKASSLGTAIDQKVIAVGRTRTRSNIEHVFVSMLRRQFQFHSWLDLSEIEISRNKDYRTRTKLREDIYHEHY
jgi:hypothetical protein